MADVEEIKGIFADTQKLTHELRGKVEALEGKSADIVDKNTMEAMKSELALKLKAAQDASAALEARLRDVETKANRPGGVEAKEVSPEVKAFGDYLRKGVESPELKSMVTGVAADGGFLIPTNLRAGIMDRLRRTSPIEAVAGSVTIQGGSYDMLVERGDSGFSWTGEESSRSETDTPTINRISIAVHELTAMPKVSQRMLDEAGFDLEGWLNGRIADRFARGRATAFIAGTGVSQPKGFLSYTVSSSADSSRAAEALQYRATGVSGDFASSDKADVFIRTFYDLQPAYQGNAVWMANNLTLATISTLKDGSGRYLIQSMLNTDGTFTNTIMGRPAYAAEDMPVVGASSLSVAVGDFSRGYTIVNGPGISVLRDPFSAKPYVLFYTIARVGGGVSDFDAIKLIRFSAS